MPEGTQSPPPERQTGKQLHEPPAKGSGVDEVGNKGDKMKSELEVSHGIKPSLYCEKHTNTFSPLNYRTSHLIPRDRWMIISKQSSQRNRGTLLAHIFKNEDASKSPVF